MRCVLIFLLLAVGLPVFGQNDFDVAFRAYDEGRYQDAITSYTRYLRRKPDNAAALHNRGLAYYQLGQYDACIADCEASLAIDASDYNCYNTYGMALHEQKRYDDAISQYKRALNYKSDYVHAHNNLGRTYLAKDMPQSAVDHLNAAIRIDSRYANAYYNRARVYRRLENGGQAMEDINYAISIRPEAFYYEWRGDLNEWLGQEADAIQDYLEWLRLNPAKELQACSKIGWISYKIGNYDQALRYFDRMATAPGGYESGGKSLTLARAGRWSEAITHADKVLANQSNEWNALAAKAYAAHKLGRKKDALDWITKALESNYKDPDVWFVKGLISKDNGQITEARDAFQYAVSFGPRYKEARRELDQIGRSVGYAVRLYVEGRVNEWQKKGKYETTAEYQTRMQQREEKIRQFTDEVLGKLKTERIQQTRWKLANTDHYDADNQTYLLEIPPYKNLVLPVPRQEAEAFDAAFLANALSFSEQDLVLVEEDWRIRRFQVTNTRNGKTYLYDSKVPASYNTAAFQFNFAPIDISLPAQQGGTGPALTTSQVQIGQSEVDTDIPRVNFENPDAIAVIIGNSDYEETEDVPFARQDALTMKKYLVSAFGFREGNIILEEDAGLGDFQTLFGTKDNPKGRLYNTIKPGLSDVFIFYAGHGAPDVDEMTGYFVPVEADPNYVKNSGYSLNVFYDNLSKLPARSITVILDACFSGAGILKNMSPIGIKPKKADGLLNGVVISSATDTQVSTWYNEKGHGLFTYFFLKAIHRYEADQNQDGVLTFDEVYGYISDNTNGVPYQARRLHGRQQTPVITGSYEGKILLRYR